MNIFQNLPRPGIWLFLIAAYTTREIRFYKKPEGISRPEQSQDNSIPNSGSISQPGSVRCTQIRQISILSSYLIEIHNASFIQYRGIHLNLMSLMRLD
jgi:hypothetical protein